MHFWAYCDEPLKSSEQSIYEGCSKSSCQGPRVVMIIYFMITEKCIDNKQVQIDYFFDTICRKSLFHESPSLITHFSARLRHIDGPPYSQSSLKSKFECECGLSEDFVFTDRTQFELESGSFKLECSSLSAADRVWFDEVIFTVLTQLGIPLKLSEDLSADNRALNL